MAKEPKLLRNKMPSNIKKLCYCCQENPSTFLLWNRKGDNETYGEMLQNCFCIEFVTNDDEVICVDCIDQLQASVKFKQQVTCAQNKELSYLVEDDNDDIGCDIEYLEPFFAQEIEEKVDVKKEQPRTQYIVNPDDFTKLENKKYQCKKCDKILDDYVHTLRHMNTFHYKTASFECEHCNEKFKSKYRLNKHIVLAHGEVRAAKSAKSKVKSKKSSKSSKKTSGSKKQDVKDMLAQEKKRRAKEMEQLEKIKRFYERKEKKEKEVTEKKKAPPLKPEDFTKISKTCLQCAYCSKKYKNRDVIRKHVNNVHRGIPTEFCDLCDETFKTRTRLVKHKFEAHNIDRRISCKACDKSFWDVNTLNTHMKIFHKLGEQKKCTYCDYTTYHENILKDHITKHTKEIRFVCQFCNKGFSRSDAYKYHVMIHTGDKRKECKICGQRFVQRTSLSVHIKTHHPNDMVEAKGLGIAPIDTTEESQELELDNAVDSIKSTFSV